MIEFVAVIVLFGLFYWFFLRKAPVVQNPAGAGTQNPAANPGAPGAPPATAPAQAQATDWRSTLTSKKALVWGGLGLAAVTLLLWANGLWFFAPAEVTSGQTSRTNLEVLEANDTWLRLTILGIVATVLVGMYWKSSVLRWIVVITLATVAYFGPGAFYRTITAHFAAEETVGTTAPPPFVTVNFTATSGEVQPISMGPNQIAVAAWPGTMGTMDVSFCLVLDDTARDTLRNNGPYGRKVIINGAFVRAEFTPSTAVRDYHIQHGRSIELRAYLLRDDLRPRC